MSTPDVHPNVTMLRTIYADLSCIDKYSADNVVLHRAERDVVPDLPPRVIGKEAVLARELELIRMTGNTLVMDVQHISANDYFGSVMGILRARINGRDIGMPFCGLWRFQNGRILEHWENAYDAASLGQLLGA